MKFISRLLLYFLLAGIVASSVFAEAKITQKEVVKIGVIIPLTGGLSLRGDDVTKLLSILERHLAQDKFKYSYKFIIEDGKCGSGNATTTAAMKLINFDKVKFLITGCTGETIQAASIAEKNKVINIAVLSLHQDIKKLGDYIFRTFMDIEKSLQGFAEFMDNQSEGKIAILTEENAFTFGIRDLLTKYLGAKIVFSQDFSADSSDFNTLLTKINAKGAKGIYLNVMSEGTLANLVNQTRALKMAQKLYTFTMPEASSFRTATGKNSDNLYFIGTPDIKNSSSEFRGILDEYVKQHPEGPSYEFILRTSYDAVKSIVDGVESVGTDSTKVKDFLYHYSVLGALGKVEYDSNGDIKNIHYVLKRVKEDGKNEFSAVLVKAE